MGRRADGGFTVVLWQVVRQERTFEAAGQFMRAASTPFGMAVSHGTLAISTDAVQSVIRRWGLGMGGVRRRFDHDISCLTARLCEGYLSGRPICVAAFLLHNKVRRALTYCWKGNIWSSRKSAWQWLSLELTSGSRSIIA
jgi:hypothetical protein